jgi:hypothetical protein
LATVAIAFAPLPPVTFSTMNRTFMIGPEVLREIAQEHVAAAAGAGMRDERHALDGIGGRLGRPIQRRTEDAERAEHNGDAW